MAVSALRKSHCPNYPLGICIAIIQLPAYLLVVKYDESLSLFRLVKNQALRQEDQPYNDGKLNCRTVLCIQTDDQADTRLSVEG